MIPQRPSPGSAGGRRTTAVGPRPWCPWMSSCGSLGSCARYPELERRKMPAGGFATPTNPPQLQQGAAENHERLEGGPTYKGGAITGVVGARRPLRRGWRQPGVEGIVRAICGLSVPTSATTGTHAGWGSSSRRQTGIDSQLALRPTIISERPSQRPPHAIGAQAKNALGTVTRIQIERGPGSRRRQDGSKLIPGPRRWWR